MLDALRFVQGALRKTALSPEMEHYQISGGRIIGYNGHLALSSPISLELSAHPKADLFIKAIQACETETSISLTPSARLSIISGKFRAFVPCLPEAPFDVQPKGTRVELQSGVLKALTRAMDFISEDASRPWAMGALIHGGAVMATNNVTFIQLWAGSELSALPTMNIPRFAVQEMIRIGEEPVAMQSDGNSLTLHYKGDKWLRCQLYDVEWPFDRLQSLFEVPHAPIPFEPGIKEAIEKLHPFIESKATPLYFTEFGITTSLAADEGVAYQVDNAPAGTAFNLKQLELVSAVADRIDWTLFPKPCIFYGENLRGMIMGRTL
jgi:hypothetical protein